MPGSDLISGFFGASLPTARFGRSAGLAPVPVWSVRCRARRDPGATGIVAGTERRPPIPISAGRSRSDVRPGRDAGRAHRPDRPRDAPLGRAAVRSGLAGARPGLAGLADSGCVRAAHPPPRPIVPTGVFPQCLYYQYASTLQFLKRTWSANPPVSHPICWRDLHLKLSKNSFFDKDFSRPRWGRSSRSYR
jgi:hypothetical protein